MATPACLGYHPLIATWAKTGDVLHARLRKGSSQRGHKRFVEELIARVRRAGATGALSLRADAGFFSYALIDTLVRLGVAYSITVNINAQVRACIDAIPESAWRTIAYPDAGVAQVAETTYVTGVRGQRRQLRLVLRRSRLADPCQLALWPEWRHHAFVTNVALDTIEADAFHRAHAGIELAIRDLKEGQVSSTAPRVTSSPTPPGSPAPSSPTTSSAGVPAWVMFIPTHSSPWPAACAPTYSPSRVASSTAVEPSCCASPSDGRGRPRSPERSSRFEPCPSSHESRHRGRAQPQTLSMR